MVPLSHTWRPSRRGPEKGAGAQPGCHVLSTLRAKTAPAHEAQKWTSLAIICSEFGTVCRFTFPFVAHLSMKRRSLHSTTWRSRVTSERPLHNTPHGCAHKTPICSFYRLFWAINGLNCTPSRTRWGSEQFSEHRAQPTQLLIKECP